MVSYVSGDLRKFIAKRVYQLCDFCLVHEDERGFG
jgi:hypothetical protein